MILYIFLGIFHLFNMKNLILNFKSKSNNNLKENNLIEYLFLNEIYTEIKIGTPEQKINMFIKLQQFPTFITSADYNEGSGIKYNQNKSTTFQYLNKKKYNYLIYDFINGNLCIDIVYFNDKEKINEFQFVLANELKENVKEYTGEIGLSLYAALYATYKRNESIINQLKKNNIIDGYTFHIKYTDKNNDLGKLIIGDYLHNYDNNYLEKDLIYTDVNYIDGSHKWGFYVNNIYIGNDNFIKNSKNIILQIEFGLIQGDLNYYNKIKEIFFNKYSNECIEKNFKRYDNITYIYFVCNSNVDIKKFPDLKFNNEIIKYNFTLNYEDLFYNYKGNNYFLVIFDASFKKQNWIIGKPIFIKYLIMFDYDKKRVGIYKKYETPFNFPIVWILVMILIILLLSKIIYDQLNKKRRIRANELDDNYDYLPQEKINI